MSRHLAHLVGRLLGFFGLRNKTLNVQLQPHEGAERNAEPRDQFGLDLSGAVLGETRQPQVHDAVEQVHLGNDVGEQGLMGHWVRYRDLILSQPDFLASQSLPVGQNFLPLIDQSHALGQLPDAESIARWNKYAAGVQK